MARKIEPGRGYRLLLEGETILEGDEYFDKGSWHAVVYTVGSRFAMGTAGRSDMRRKVSKAPRKAPKLQDTSLEAKESQKDKAPVDREIIMGHMKKHPRGTTCDRLEVLLGMSHQTASARINDLARAGRIVDSGRREKTRTGRNAICWKAVAK